MELTADLACVIIPPMNSNVLEEVVRRMTGGGRDEEQREFAAIAQRMVGDSLPAISDAVGVAVAALVVDGIPEFATRMFNQAPGLRGPALAIKMLDTISTDASRYEQVMETLDGVQEWIWDAVNDAAEAHPRPESLPGVEYAATVNAVRQSLSDYMDILVDAKVPDHAIVALPLALGTVCMTARLALEFSARKAIRRAESGDCSCEACSGMAEAAKEVMDPSLARLLDSITASAMREARHSC